MRTQYDDVASPVDVSRLSTWRVRLTPASLLFLIVVSIGSTLAASPVDAPLVSDVVVPRREGVVELDRDEAAALLDEVAHDQRYTALEQIVTDRELRLEKMSAKAALLPEGYRATFVPVLNDKGEDQGFLASGGGNWTLSIKIAQPNRELIETYRATLDENGHARVEAIPAPREAIKPEFDHGRVAASNAYYFTYPTTSCQYVSRYSINYGCVSFWDNPAGYYYTVVYRFGTTPDPRSPSWWSCWQGYIHVCPRFESPGSPRMMPRCGFPPRHPNG